MIWLIAIGSSLYSLSLVALGFYLAKRVLPHGQQPTYRETHGTNSETSEKTKPTSAPLKSMTPLERSLEDSKEIKERIEHLLQ